VRHRICLPEQFIQVKAHVLILLPHTYHTYLFQLESGLLAANHCGTIGSATVHNRCEWLRLPDKCSRQIFRIGAGSRKPLPLQALLIQQILRPVPQRPAQPLADDGYGKAHPGAINACRAHCATPHKFLQQRRAHNTA